MNYFLLFLAVPFFFIACTTTSHLPESRPLNFKEGITQVQVKFDEEDQASVGSEVSALNLECKTKFQSRGRQRVSCIKKLIGIGTIIGINNNISIVEFKSQQFAPDVEYEVLKKEEAK